MSTHEIIKATETPQEVFLTIRWGDAGHQTMERMSFEAAKALGYQRPDPQPVDPAWMVEVAREVCARRCERLHRTSAAEMYRSGNNDGLDAVQDAITALRLALSRGHVVLAPVMPSEEEMLKDAREDAARFNEAGYEHSDAIRMRAGKLDDGYSVSLALQARRNVYASIGAVAGKAVSSGPVVPEVDLREALGAAWRDGFISASNALCMLCNGEGDATTLYANVREKDVSAILENLKSGEA